MDKFKETLRKAEPVFSIPGLVDEFENFDDTVKNICEDAWKKVREHILMDFASKMQIDLSMAKKEVQLIYISLLKRYISTLLEYPSKSSLRLNASLDDINMFLLQHGYKKYTVHSEEEETIDIFLYIDTAFVKSCSGKNIKIPFFIGINYDSSIEQDSITKLGAFQIFNISPSGLAEKLEKDFDFIDMMRFEQYSVLREF